MSMREAQDEILREHAELRRAIAEVGDVLERFSQGEREATEALRSSAGALYTRFIAHLVLEDRVLVPSLQDCFGPTAADPLVRDHAEQRALLSYLIRRLSPKAAPTQLVANDLRQFLVLLREDMADEERMLAETVARRPETGER